MNFSSTKKIERSKTFETAGPEEVSRMRKLIAKLTDQELKLLSENLGIRFLVDENVLVREDFERVIDEAYCENFYREYRKIIERRKKTS